MNAAAAPTGVTEADVRRRLNEILDPCSVAAGAPAGLDEMGLVREVRLEPGVNGQRLTVVIGVTEYGCLLGAAFGHSAYERLDELPGVEAVDVRLDDRFDWAPSDMAPAYQERLEAKRAAVRARPLHFHPPREKTTKGDEQ